MAHLPPQPFHQLELADATVALQGQPMAKGLEAAVAPVEEPGLGDMLAVIPARLLRPKAEALARPRLAAVLAAGLQAVAKLEESAGSRLPLLPAGGYAAVPESDAEEARELLALLSSPGGGEAGGGGAAEMAELGRAGSALGPALSRLVALFSVGLGASIDPHL